MHTFIYRVPLKYSNRTYAYAQNTLIEQSFLILRFQINKGQITKGVLYFLYVYNFFEALIALW